MTEPNKFLMGYAGKNHLDTGMFLPSGYVPPMLPNEPSAVDRLAGTIDPEAKARCDEIDQIRREGTFQVKTFDMVSDPALPSATPTAARSWSETDARA